LPEGRQRATANAAGEDATHLLHAAWYGLSDPGMEDALYDSESISRFAIAYPTIWPVQRSL